MTKYPGRYCPECDDVYAEDRYVCPTHDIATTDIPDDFYERYPGAKIIAEMMYGENGGADGFYEKDLTVDRALREFHAEFLRASSKFAPFNSAHEGYAILLEEVDELWEAVKKNDTVNMREEAVQVGAMALRFIVNVLDKKGGGGVEVSQQATDAEKLAAYDLYVPLLLKTLNELYSASEQLMSIHVRHSKHPELDTEEARRWRKTLAIASVDSAQCQYLRVVRGENVGCLVDDEEPEDREQFMEAVASLRRILGIRVENGKDG